MFQQRCEGFPPHPIEIFLHEFFQGVVPLDCPAHGHQGPVPGAQGPMDHAAVEREMPDALPDVRGRLAVGRIGVIGVPDTVYRTRTSDGGPGRNDDRRQDDPSGADGTAERSRRRGEIRRRTCFESATALGIRDPVRVLFRAAVGA